MDGLGRLGGAHDIQVDLNTGWVTLRCGPDEAIDLASVPRAIRDAGFEPTALELEARGELVKAPDDTLALHIHGWPLTLPIARSTPTPAPGTAHVHAHVTGWQDGEPLQLVLVQE